jgi:integrase
VTWAPPLALKARAELGWAGDGLMPDLPKAAPPDRKLPSAPSTDEVNGILRNATGWLSVAVALGALAGLRQGAVRALEVRDVDLKERIVTVRCALSENRLGPAG